MLNWDTEREFDASGTLVICGTDEAGRGPLAGPVCAAAVILPRGIQIEGLNDSKKLTAKKRDLLYDEIRNSALAYGIAAATESEIDEMNILQASLLAMRRAIAELTPQPDLILVDGNTVRGFEQRAVAIVGGDAKSPNIAAASVLAKVTRDRLMEELDRLYPEYGFAAHKGYPTKQHYIALNRYGPSPVHRKTFLKKMHVYPEE